MKISMWSSFLYGRPFPEIVRSLRQAGFDSVDLSDEHLKELVNDPHPFERAREWHALTGEIGLPMLQNHLVLDSDLTREGTDAEEEMDFLKKELELSVYLKIPAAVLHVGRYELHGDEAKRGQERAVKRLQTLVRLIKGSGTAIAIENLPVTEKRAEDILKLIELAGNPPELGICLDTGHLHCTGGDQLEFLKTANSRLIALHIADNTGVADYHMLPMGRGTIDWRSFMKALMKSGYPGIFNFEASGENSAFYPEMLDDKLLYSARVARILLKMGEEA